MSAPHEPDHTENKVIHEVDGIQEYDNKLPNWWLYTLYGTVAFAVVYWFHYHVAGYGALPTAELQAENDKAAAIAAERIKKEGVLTPEALTALSHDKGTLEQGKQVFAQTCAQCHRGDGGGMVGPNLTDEFWLHGAAPDKILETISKGVPDKGMPAWGPQLGADRTRAVTAFVISLRGTNVPNGKAPQGERASLSLR
ncbi:MAG: c-type cytochrome [Deltaproteobacteria bacterium]|nr:c-type cytochrome [Deltaproteobacteria bacterium]